MSSSEHHKRTKRVNECEITLVDNENQEDPVIKNLTKIGCLEKHYAVQDCYFETKDWRKCTKEVNEFKECIKQAKK
jgi:cytochrome c oxidase assembly factor 4